MKIESLELTDDFFKFMNECHGNTEELTFLLTKTEAPYTKETEASF